VVFAGGMAVVLRQWCCFKRWRERAERDRGYCSSLPLCPPSFSSTVFLSFLSSLFLLLFFNLLCFFSSFLSLFSSPLLFFLFFYFSLSASPPFILLSSLLFLYFSNHFWSSLLFVLPFCSIWFPPVSHLSPPLLFFFPFSPLFIGGQGR